MDFYIDPRNRDLGQIIDESVQTFVQVGGRFKDVKIPSVEDYSLPRMKQKYSFERKAIGLVEATKIAISDLTARIAQAPEHPDLPVTMIFLLDFEIDDKLWKRIMENPKSAGPEAVKEVSLRFWYDEDPATGPKISVSIHPWEEYVLMYGEEETHGRNKLKILQIAEGIYEQARPYFAWMDNETESSDQSFDLLRNGDLPTGNEFVMVGPTMIHLLDIEKLQSSKFPWKRLADGGIMIQNPYRYKKPEPRMI